MTFNSGAIYENVQHYAHRVSPRASLNWKVTNTQSFRIGASRGYRIPSLLERNFDKRIILANGEQLLNQYYSSPNLGPEKIDSYELGYLGSISALPISWDLKLYRDEIRNIYGFPIDSSSADQTRVISNVGKHTAKGLEGEVTYHHDDENFVKFIFNVGESEYINKPRINPDVIETTKIAMPEESYGLLGSKSLYSWNLNMGVYYVSEIDWLNLGDTGESYIRTDISLQNTVKIKSGDLKLKLSSQNIEKEYREFDSRRPFKERYQITLSFTQN